MKVLMVLACSASEINNIFHVALVQHNLEIIIYNSNGTDCWSMQHLVIGPGNPRVKITDLYPYRRPPVSSSKGTDMGRGFNGFNGFENPCKGYGCGPWVP